MTSGPAGHGCGWNAAAANTAQRYPFPTGGRTAGRSMTQEPGCAAPGATRWGATPGRNAATRPVSQPQENSALGAADDTRACISAVHSHVWHGGGVAPCGPMPCLSPLLSRDIYAVSLIGRLQTGRNPATTRCPVSMVVGSSPPPGGSCTPA